MWSLNSIASRAAGAITSAKKGITDMTKELPPETSPERKPDQSLQALKKQNFMIKKKIESQNDEINSYKSIIEDLLKEKNNLLNFKIVIGKDSDDQNCSEEIFDLQRKITKFSEENEKLHKDIDSFKHQEMELKAFYECKIKAMDEKISDWEVKCEELQAKSNQNELLGVSHSESLQKHKMRVQQSIAGIYGILKNSFETVGLVIPNVKVEQLGLEDLQEFIFTQAKYYEDALKSFEATCKGSGKEGKTLEDFKNVFVKSLAELAEGKVAAQQKVAMIEAKIEKVSKEKEDLFKINTKKDERIKVLIEQIGKNGEEIKICQELKDEHPRILAQVKDLTTEVEKWKKICENLKETSCDYEKKREKHKKKLETLKNNNTNLNKRLKILNTTLSEKEQQLRTLQEAANILQAELRDLKSNSDEYKKASEKNLCEVNTYFLSKLKETEDTSEKKLSESQKRLKDTQNDLKDSKLENIQLLNKLKRMEELEKNLGYLGQQNSANQKTIDKLILDKDSLSLTLQSKDKQILKLEHDLQVLETSFQASEALHGTEKEGLMMKIRETENVRLETENLLKRVEQEMLANQTMIDKRVVATFLMNYTNEKYNGKAKMQMLTAIAEMVGMTPEERVKIGVVHESGFFSQVSGYLRR